MILKDLSLGERMKFYEKNFAYSQLVPLLPICVRLDGKAFHSWTRGLKRPYDERLSSLFIDTTKYLLEETNADIGYTQSDEITLIWKNDNLNSETYFGGKRDKIVSITSSMCTYYFNYTIMPYNLSEKLGKPALFDSRCFQVPNLTEAVNLLIWREQDATRNSIQMAAQHYYSHKDLQNKNCDELQEMLHAKGINWNNYPVFFKRGTYLKKVKLLRNFTFEEIDKLPENHEARKNPNLKIERSSIVKLDLPPLTQIENREGCLFHNKSEIIHGIN